MKAFLMHCDRDFDPKQNQQPNAEDLMRDLELEILFRSMAGGDEFLFEIAEGAVLASLRDRDTILYRQQILADCIEHPDIARRIYAIAVEAIEREKRIWGWFSTKYPESTLHHSTEVLQIFAELLPQLRTSADTHAPEFRSEGFKRLFTMLSTELNDEYLRTIGDHLQRLKFREGILMSAQLGEGNKGINYVLRKPRYVAHGWFDRLRSRMGQRSGEKNGFTYEIDERDEAGYRALSELRNRGIAQIAAALAQSIDHILSFFRMLRLELGFYIGCLNLRDVLLEKQEPFCFPVPIAEGQTVLNAQGLYDISLRLTSPNHIVRNAVTANGKALIVITGANRGGKSTFLRSVGLAQIMMQCGMFVPAESFSASLSQSVFTHFRREEDVTLKSGKLDEELSRMSGIVENLTPHSMVLLNESFASTNEREGSEIARQIVRALLEMGIKVLYVTHMFDLAHGFYRERKEEALFLRAERLPDGERTFRLLPGEPLPTSFGEDLYRRIFCEGSNAAAAHPPTA
jgi:DNA mismatch repair ATPase MutS